MQSHLCLPLEQLTPPNLVLQQNFAPMNCEAMKAYRNHFCVSPTRRLIAFGQQHGLCMGQMRSSGEDTSSKLQSHQAQHTRQNPPRIHEFPGSHWPFQSGLHQEQQFQFKKLTSLLEFKMESGHPQVPTHPCLAPTHLFPTGDEKKHFLTQFAETGTTLTLPSSQPLLRFLRYGCMSVHNLIYHCNLCRSEEKSWQSLSSA